MWHRFIRKTFATSNSIFLARNLKNNNKYTWPLTHAVGGSHTVEQKLIILGTKTGDKGIVKYSHNTLLNWLSLCFNSHYINVLFNVITFLMMKMKI